MADLRLTDPRLLPGDPHQVAQTSAAEWRRAVAELRDHFGHVEAMVRNARMQQIAEAIDPRAVGISPSKELYDAWEASTDASLCARTIGVLDLLAQLAEPLHR